MNNTDIEEVIKKLYDYAHLDGTEVGELTANLAQMWESYGDYISSEFKTALEKEMVDQLNNFEQNCEIVEREVETKRVEKVKELVWKIWPIINSPS